MTTLRLVIFDCDGTLVDSQRTIIGAMNSSFTQLGLPSPTDDAIRRVVGLSLHESMVRLHPGGSDVEHEELIAGYRSAFFEMRSAPDHEEPLYPGVVAVLDHIEQEGILAGVATGKSMRGLKATLARHAIHDRFITLQTADQNPGKPHPAMVQRAMEEAGVEPDNTMVVGDTTYDIEMGRAAGAYAVGVSWGYHPVDELHTAGAHAVINDFGELNGALARFMALE